MPVLNISKFEQVQIKTEGVMPGTTFPLWDLFVAMVITV